MIQIDPKDGVPIYRQVMDQIKLLVMTGKLVPGQQLESVSSLSGRLKVNPMTISKAYGFLVEEGVVDRRKGVGIFVAEVDQAAADENRRFLLSETLREAAGLAVQMEVSAEDTLEILRCHLDAFGKKKGKKS